MKCVILAGGLGTRISEETRTIPKPMVDVGGKPLIHHVMDIYTEYGINEFIIATGYKKSHIIAYFIDLADNTSVSKDAIIFYIGKYIVTVVDTGIDSMTGGRLGRLKSQIGNERFLMTYGDGVGNINLSGLVSTHAARNSMVTLTAVRPIPRFGSLKFDLYGKVDEFSEKMVGESDWINGGFFIIEPEALDYIKDDSTNWEKDVLPVLAREGKLSAYMHTGYWQCCDTVRDLEKLREDYQEKGEEWLKSL